MSFAGPIWLWGLIPWGALAIWLLLGLRKRKKVPFLNLWKTAEPIPSKRRKIEIPPTALACLAAAVLVAILAAAGPRWGRPINRSHSVLVLVDRGITMSDPRRFDSAMRSAQQALEGRFDPRSIGYLNLPTGQKGDAAAARRWPATAINTANLLNAEAGRALRDGMLVVIVSDQSILISDPQLFQFAPAGVMEDVGISRIAASVDPAGGPGGQVMVRLVNHSVRQDVELQIRSGGEITVHRVPLAADGRARDEFIDLPSLASQVEARLLVQDSIPLNNAACLVLQGQKVKIEPLFTLPAELGRLAEIYQQQQPPGQSAGIILMARDAASLPSAMMGAVLPPVGDRVSGPVDATDHPAVSHVNWGRWSWNLATQSPPADWRPLLTVGGKTAIAAIDHPIRRIWVGLESDEFARDPRFVIFWTDVWDWLAGGKLEYAAQTVHRLSADWHCQAQMDADLLPGLLPGIWQSAGRQLALNAGDFAWSQATDTAASADRLAAIGGSEAAGGFNAGAVLIFLSLSLLGIAALLWPRERLTRSGGTRTV